MKIVSCRNAVMWRALVGMVSVFAMAAQTTEFDRLIGRDLWEQRLSPGGRSRLWHAIGRVPEIDDTGELEPWYVWKTSHSDRAPYVVLLGGPEMMVPGGSSACVVLFGAAAKRIGSQCFQTGWRFQLSSASLEYSANLQADLVIIYTFAANYPNITRAEYFAIRDDRLRFVRVEDEKREAVQNNYLIPNAEVGFAPDVNTVDECIAMLKSGDKADVLAELVFLGGKHILGRRPVTVARWHFVESTESRYAGLFLQAMDDARVRELIRKRSASSDKWIRQEALLAARDPRKRPDW